MRPDLRCYGSPSLRFVIDAVRRRGFVRRSEKFLHVALAARSISAEQ